jgi:hypothetical protein
MVVAVVLTACSPNEQCLELLTSGLQATQTQYVMTTASPVADAGAIDLVGESKGLVLNGWHSVTCTSPALADQETLFVTWYDDGPSDPTLSYCQFPYSALCRPQPGQPWGEVTVLFPARGYTTVTVPVYAAN